MPNQTGTSTILSGLACFGIGRVLGIPEFYLLGSVLVALVAFSVVWVQVLGRTTSATRTVAPHRIPHSASATITYELVTSGPVTAPLTHLTDEIEGVLRVSVAVGHFDPGEPYRARYRFRPDGRGPKAIGPLRLEWQDPFGIARFRRSSIADEEVLALPRIDDVRPPPQAGAKAQLLADKPQDSIAENGEDFSSLRPYHLGDDLRRVHWRTSARRDDLVVRLEHTPRHGRSLIVLDVRSIAADALRFEAMVSAAASIVSACRKRGDMIRLLFTDGTLLEALDKSTFDSMIDELALVQQHENSRIHLSLATSVANCESAVLIVADNAVSLIESLYRSGDRRRNTITVTFASSRDRSSMVAAQAVGAVSIDHDQSFALAWNHSRFDRRRAKS